MVILKRLAGINSENVLTALINVSLSLRAESEKTRAPIRSSREELKVRKVRIAKYIYIYSRILNNKTSKIKTFYKFTVILFFFMSIHGQGLESAPRT